MYTMSYNTANRKKRTALRALDPNIQPTKRVRRPKTRPQESALPSNLPPQPPQLPQPSLSPHTEPQPSLSLVWQTRVM